MRRFIDDNITVLSQCEVFVFGSNLQGHHPGSAASVAYEKFGAEWGVGIGPTGQCYAIPVIRGNLGKIKSYVDDFIEYARSHPNNRFLVTRIGCGKAGFSDKEMSSLFTAARDLPNVNFPKKWLTFIHSNRFFDAMISDFPPKEKPINTPDALTESDLISLCEEYRYVIGSGVIVPLPRIKIRYVIDNGRFGYAHFGDFFMCNDGELYVWDSNNEFASSHNQDMVEAIFEDECKERNKFFHRAIFAGVETPFNDRYGKKLYTGDVIRVWLKYYIGHSPKDYDKNSSLLLALGTLGENSEGEEAIYACALDNHCVMPDMCQRIERCGTVLYGLDLQEIPVTITDRCADFNDIYGTNKMTDEEKEILAAYTPNFEKELWKYNAYKTLGIEFNQ